MNAPLKAAALYTPEPGDLVHRVCTWFLQSKYKTETLTAAEAAQEFGVASGHIVRSQLRAGVEHQYLLDVAHDGDKHYAPGPRIRELLAIPSTRQIGASMPFPSAPNAVKKRTVSKPLPLLDFAGITIDTDVPKPATHQALRLNYLDLIERMQPGNSVLLPTAYAKRVADWAKKRSAEFKLNQRYSTRLVDDATMRLWRDA